MTVTEAYRLVELEQEHGVWTPGSRKYNIHTQVLKPLHASSVHVISRQLWSEISMFRYICWEKLQEIPNRKGAKLNMVQAILDLIHSYIIVFLLEICMTCQAAFQDDGRPKSFFNNWWQVASSSLWKSEQPEACESFNIFQQLLCRFGSKVLVLPWDFWIWKRGSVW